MSDLVPLQHVREARARLGNAVHRTPLVGSRTLSERVGAPLHLKCENLQKTGSFKVRGALNRILASGPGVRERGVVTVSAGNHAQALAWAASMVGIPATVVMPRGASRTKARASAAYGAEVLLHGTAHEAFARAEELAVERGLELVHPFDDPEIIAGHGTAGLEILEDLPDVSAVVVPVGGGGLIAGIAAAVTRLRPDVRVYGVEPEGAAAMRASLEAGSPLELERVETVADGLAAPMAGALTFAHVRDLVHDVVTVTDDEIVYALRLLLSRAKLLAEPAGAAGVAALLSGRIALEPGASVVAVVSGGNVDMDRLAELLQSSEE